MIDGLFSLYCLNVVTTFGMSPWHRDTTLTGIGVCEVHELVLYIGGVAMASSGQKQAVREKKSNIVFIRNE